MVKNRIELLGYKLGVIEVVKDFRKNGQRKLCLKCSVCGVEKEVWYSNYITGNWSVCEHDAL
mgnify:CR=1 FL=1